MKKFVSTGRLGVLAIAVLLASASFIACNKSDNGNNPNTPLAGLMAFNLVPEKSAGFSISGNNITSVPLSFNSYTGGYVAIFPGSRTVEAYNFGSGSSFDTTTYNFEANKYYSAFLVGGDSSYRQVIVRDNFDSLASASQAFVRYINAIPDASAVSVTVSINGSNVVNENAAFASVSGFVPVNPGAVTISVSNGGTINVTRTITLEQQKVYTILLSGKPGAAGDNAVQIKYIQNGTVDETMGKTNSSGILPFN